MARTSANSVGPATAISTISQQLDKSIAKAMKDFHNHSKECRGCRNPIASYENGQDLCETGRIISVELARLLYKKAEHVPGGCLTISYKKGWEAVDGLVTIIAHYNQNEFTTTIDLGRMLRHREAQEQQAVIDNARIPRGSLHAEDSRRYERAPTTGPTRIPRSSPRQSAANLSAYGNPRTSLLDVQTNRTQADISPASSSRSVHFDTHVHVREFSDE